MKFTIQTALNVLLVVMIGIFIGRYFYLQPGYTNGEVAPEISGRLIGGSPWSMSEMRGQYVLLDFWGSWCPPCRKKNPDLVELYRKYHGVEYQDNQGFEIVSVAVERNRASWEQAIEKDGLIWPFHLLDLSENLRFFEGSLAAEYGVKQLPTTYLIGPEGKIIGVNPSVKQIAQMLDKALASPIEEQ